MEEDIKEHLFCFTFLSLEIKRTDLLTLFTWKQKHIKPTKFV